jgi:hypothetical protein
MIAQYELLKDWIAPVGEAGRTLVHIHFGLFFFLTGAAFSRKRLRAWPVLLALLALQLANEVADLAFKWPDIPRWLWADSFYDTLNTMVWPTLIFLLALDWHAADRAGEQPQPGSPSGEGEAGAPSSDGDGPDADGAR